MVTTLLQQFVKEECTPYVRRLLEEALVSAPTSSKRFEFNRFEVTFESEGTVLLEDVLDATTEGAERVPLAAFAAAISACPE